MATEENQLILSKLVTGSGYERTKNCKGSVVLSAGMPERVRDAFSEEGTEAHDWASKILLKEVKEEDVPEKFWDGNLSEYIEYVKTIQHNLIGEYQFIVEKRFYLWPDKPDVAPSGQLDALIIQGSHAWIVDLKWGVGQPVNAATSEQLRFYAALARANFPQVKTVHAAIIQPRIGENFGIIGSVTSVTFPYQTLDAIIREIEGVVEELKTDMSIVPGKWCQFCSAMTRCPVYKGATELIETEGLKFSVAKIDAKELTDEDIDKLTYLYAFKGRVNKWFTEAEKVLFSLLSSGRETPGFELGNKNKNRAWKFDKIRTAKELKARGLKKPFNESLVSPAQAEKLGIDTSGLWEKPKGELAVKPKAMKYDSK